MAKLICPNCKEILDSMNKRLEFCPYCGKKLSASSESDSTITEKSLIERMYIFLADSEFENADLYSERILDINPKCAEAYLGKFMAKSKICSIENIENLDSSISENLYFNHAIEYADITLKQRLIDCLSTIHEREKEKKYANALKQMDSTPLNDATLITLMETFEELNGYKNTGELSEKAKKLLIQKAECYIKQDTISSHQHAIEILNIITTSNEPNTKIQYCQKRINAIKRKNKKLLIINTTAIFLLALILSYAFYFADVFKYNKAKNLVDNKNYKKAISILEQLDDFRDSENLLYYSKATLHMNEGNYNQAIALFNNVRNFKDSTDKINEIQSGESWIKSCNRGDYITFGSYEQDNDISNGKERVEWLVLDKKADSMLVISKHVLDCKRFHYISHFKKEVITWEICDLRKWMNDAFMNTLFSQDEKEKIMSVTVPAHKNPTRYINSDPLAPYRYAEPISAGNDTQDKLFLLSIKEASEYFETDAERISSPTKYAVANGIQKSKKGNCCWWLRTVGMLQSYTSFVSNTGEVRKGGYSADCIDYGVRPAMWIEIE